MPFLFWLDIAALSVSTVVACAIFLLIIISNPRLSHNRYFAGFVFSVAGWTICGLLLRLSLWIGKGNPHLLLNIGIFFICLTGSLLLLFTTRYLSVKSVIIDICAYAGFIILAVYAIPLFQNKVIENIVLAPNGTVLLDVNPWGLIGGMLVIGYILWAYILFWKRGKRKREIFFPISLIIFVCGYFLGGILEIPLPILSITNTVSMGILGYGIFKRQIFNPLKNIMEELEQEVEERTRELKSAYAEIEKRVDDRTRELRKEVAERRKTEEVLRESEAKFRNLAEQSPNMIFINRKGKIVYANKKCEEIMGYSREELYNPYFFFYRLIAEDNIEMIKEKYARHIKGENIPAYEYTLVTKDGRQIEAINTTTLIRYDGEDAILGIVTDITKRKRTERILNALHEAALAMEQTYSLDEVFTIAGMKLKNLDCSCALFIYDRATQMLLVEYCFDRKSGKEFLINRDETLIPVRFSLKESKTIKEALLKRKNIFINSDILTPSEPIKEGVYEYMEFLFVLENAIAVPLIAEDVVIGLLIIRSDDLSEEDIPAISAFTCQVAAAWRKSSLLCDLKAKVLELKQTQQQLIHTRKMEAIGKLAGSIAHDFNNLLTVIVGYTHLIISQLPPDDPNLDELSGIKKAADQAVELTSQLLAFSRKQVMNPQKINLNTIIESIRVMIGSLIGEQIRLVVYHEKDLNCIKADEGQLKQVLLNLAINARDAMMQGGRLTIKTENVHFSSPWSDGINDVPAGEYVVLSVSDNGIGMDPEVQSHIFEPFYTTKEKSKGTGLGLSTVYGIVKQSKGHITVSSQPNKGTTFKLYFPARVPDVKNVSVQHHHRDGKISGSETILLVEDEQLVSSLLHNVLEKNGYRVLPAANAEEAMKIVRKHNKSIDLLITDVIMPGKLNGYELAAKIIKRIPQVRVIYMSGYIDNPLVLEGMQNPGINFLQKPFEPTVIVKKVRSVMDGDDF
ncbi:MAG: PAS domain S-box protein [Spirochaetales bacterium]|nr:PAS domain S-box protein [Spirochaetales bacterium]